MIQEELRRVVQDHSILLTESVVQQIRKAEVEREFPFDLINDLRGYLNFSPFFLAGFRTALRSAAAQRISQTALLETLGSITRFKRYFLQILIGAFLSDCMDEQERIFVLNTIGELLARRIAEFHRNGSRYASGLCDTLARTLKTTDGEKRVTSLLFIKLREFVDYMFLGEHSIVYQPYPPQTIKGCDVIVRQFSSLAHARYLPYRTITIVDGYQHGRFPFRLDLFRGRLSPVPAYSGKDFTGFVVNGRPGDHTTAMEILEWIGDAFAERQRYYRALPPMELELEKMVLYAGELENLHHLVGQEYIFPEEAKEHILENSCAKRLKTALGMETYSDAYFHILRQAMQWVLKLA